jgi:acyl-CoA thioesterase
MSGKTVLPGPEIATGLDMYVPFAEKLGVRLGHRRTGDVGLSLDLQDVHMNAWQVAHGGVVMSVLDIVMGLSAKSLDEASTGATTIEMKTNFIKPATGHIFAQGRAHRAGRSLVYVDGELRNDSQELLARATGTFKLRYPRKESD